MIIGCYTKDCYTEYTKEELLKYCEKRPEGYDSKHIKDEGSTFLPLKALIKVKKNIKVLCVSKKHKSLDKKGIDCILIDNKKKETTVQISEVCGEHCGEPPEEKREQQVFNDERNRGKGLSLPMNAYHFEEEKLQKCILKVAEIIKDNCDVETLEEEIESIIQKYFPSEKKLGHYIVNRHLNNMVYPPINGKCQNKRDSMTAEEIKNQIIQELFYNKFWRGKKGI